MTVSTAMMAIGLLGLASGPAHADSASPSSMIGRGCVKVCDDPDYCGNGPVDNHYYHYLGLTQCDFLSHGCDNDSSGHGKTWWWKQSYTDCSKGNVTDFTDHYEDEVKCTLGQ